MGLNEPKATIITIAGTNGKGTTLAVLESIYHSQGYQVGSFSSPHLIKFNERIKINKNPITDEDLVSAFKAVESFRDGVALSYFEMTTLAALWHFSKHNLQLIIIEVGLGGRLDATNIIDNDLAIITTIDFDHEAYLGNSIEAIAREKGGILRANKSFIYADLHMPQSLASIADSLSTPIYRNAKEYCYKKYAQHFQFSFADRMISLPISSYHSNSIAAAIMATICLEDKLPVDDSSRILGVQNTTLAGRLQFIRNGKISTIIDVAHNPQAARYLASYLANFKKQHFGSKIHAVFSAFNDKNLYELISPLKELVEYWYPCILPHKRSATKEQIDTAFIKNGIIDDGLMSLCYTDPVMAYLAASEQALIDDVIIVYGSFITGSMVLAYLS